MLFTSKHQTKGGYMVDLQLTHDDRETTHRIIMAKQHYEPYGAEVRALGAWGWLGGCGSWPACGRLRNSGGRAAAAAAARASAARRGAARRGAPTCCCLRSPPLRGGLPTANCRLPTADWRCWRRAPPLQVEDVLMGVMQLLLSMKMHRCAPAAAAAAAAAAAGPSHLCPPHRRHIHPAASPPPLASAPAAPPPPTSTHRAPSPCVPRPLPPCRKTDGIILSSTFPVNYFSITELQQWFPDEFAAAMEATLGQPIRVSRAAGSARRLAAPLRGAAQQQQQQQQQCWRPAAEVCLPVPLVTSPQLPPPRPPCRPARRSTRRTRRGGSTRCTTTGRSLRSRTWDKRRRRDDLGVVWCGAAAGWLAGGERAGRAGAIAACSGGDVDDAAGVALYHYLDGNVAGWCAAPTPGRRAGGQAGGAGRGARRQPAAEKRPRPSRRSRTPLTLTRSAPPALQPSDISRPSPVLSALRRALATSTMAARKALLLLGGGAAAGTGAYVALHSADASKFAQQQKQLERSQQQERTQLRKYESSIIEQEALIKALQQQSAMEQKSMGELAESIEAAKAKVAQLEAQQAQKQEDVQRLEKEAAAASTKLETAREQAVKLQQSAAATEQNLKIMQLEVQKAKELVNPLNHPKVKNLLGRK